MTKGGRKERETFKTPYYVCVYYVCVCIFVYFLALVFVFSIDMGLLGVMVYVISQLVEAAYPDTGQTYLDVVLKIFFR